MKRRTFNIAFFGSSLVSAYWNGAATYYRGIIKALHKLGNTITFFEPDAFGRQEHRDIADPEWARVMVYQPEPDSAKEMLSKTRHFDIVIKASGIGVLDSFFEAELLNNRQKNQCVIFWDVDAPATLSSMHNGGENTLRSLITEFDLILTYGGGKPVIAAYEALGARRCVPIYNALDPETHYPVKPKEPFKCDLGFIGNRLPDREARVQEFFIKPAAALPQKQFLIGGNGWDDNPFPINTEYLGHIYTKNHNAFNASSLSILNISRNNMAETGFSPATRVFEAAGAAACLITDYWQGIDRFLEPDKEVLVAHNGEDVIEIVGALTEKRAKSIGNAALKRMLGEHTYHLRAQHLTEVLNETCNHVNFKSYA